MVCFSSYKDRSIVYFFKQMIIYIYKTHINVQLRSIYRFFKEVVYRIIQ